MYKAAIRLEDITLFDLLTVDTHGGKIRIQDEANSDSYNLIPSRTIFFNSDGLYADVEKEGIILLRNQNTQIDFECLLKELDQSIESCVVLIEGFAGCGKSTLVQYILLKQLKTDKYDYSFYNYDLEAQNNLIIHDEVGNVIKKSSIYEAIKKCFFEQFMYEIKINKNIFYDFTNLLKLCREYQPFNSLFYEYFNTQTYADIISYVEESVEKNEDIISKNLWKQTTQISSSVCLLALDYLFRLSMYKNRMLDKLYVCYDNLDAIEDAKDLKYFDDELIKFKYCIDDFIALLQNKKFFSGLRTPHFVIIATYRKITAIMANISDSVYKEVSMDKYAGANQGQFIYHIDATSAFSYSKIVDKRKRYFEQYFKAAVNISKAAKEKIIEDLLSWSKLNQNLEIMHNRYARLWNQNYRTCSLIANELYREPSYQFPQYVNYIDNLKINDGYSFAKDSEGNNILCSYYGGSAIILNSVCKVFHTHHIWDEFLDLTQLNPDPPSYKKVSLSRIILTYIYNRNESVSLEDLYNTFCKNKLFSYKKLCRILANMLARNMDGVWRRPIYYASECILSEKSEDIKKILLNECKRLQEGEKVLHNYEFLLCDSGQIYVEQLMQEFEFFSNRLSNKNKPLYLYQKLDDLKTIIDSVYQAVLGCCKNMDEFRKEFIKLDGITEEKYLKLPIHPTTNKTHSPQLHTERIIFSHTSYLNNVRLYYLNQTVILNLAERKKYNEMFINYINKYLKLYNTYIHPISSKRDLVANQLIEIVNRVLDAINQDSNDLNILFQSVSLKNQKV